MNASPQLTRRPLLSPASCAASRSSAAFPPPQPPPARVPPAPNRPADHLVRQPALDKLRTLAPQPVRASVVRGVRFRYAALLPRSFPSSYPSFVFSFFGRD